MFARSHLYGLDIETDTTVDGLDPAIARITEVSLSTEDGDLIFDDADETTLLRRLDDALADLPAGLLLTWNGDFFDLPFLAVRASRRLPEFGLQLIPAPGLAPKYAPLPGFTIAHTALWRCRPLPEPVLAGQPNGPMHHQHLDIAFAYRRIAADLGVPWSLKPVCKALGIDMIEVDRERMHDLSPAERAAYVTSDTRGTRELGARLLGA